jgi:hypothetical protein
MAKQQIVCDHAGCGRTGDRDHGSWYRLMVTHDEHTTVWYCSPYCLLLDTLRFDSHALTLAQIAGLQVALSRAAEGRPRPLPTYRPAGQLRTLLASLG